LKCPEKGKRSGEIHICFDVVRGTAIRYDGTQNASRDNSDLNGLEKGWQVHERFGIMRSWVLKCAMKVPKMQADMTLRLPLSTPDHITPNASPTLHSFSEALHIRSYPLAF
jgi:hypothetical protein